MSCILSHRGIQLILAYSWARPAILVAGKGRGGIFSFLLFLHFHYCTSFFPVLLFHLLYYLFYLFLYPRHTKYVGVYSFRFSVCWFVRTLVRTFVRLFVFPSQGQRFCVKVYKTSYFDDPLMDFVHIWHDGRYRSKVFISTIPIPGVTLGSRSRT